MCRLLVAALLVAEEGQKEMIEPGWAWSNCGPVCQDRCCSIAEDALPDLEELHAIQEVFCDEPKDTPHWVVGPCSVAHTHCTSSHANDAVADFERVKPS